MIIEKAGRPMSLANSYTHKIVADLSRADVALLHRRAWGRDVLEIGAGGSTVMLAQCAKQLVSIESDPTWIKLASKAVRELPNRCDVAFHQMSGVQRVEDTFDLVFIDCIDQLRAPWTRHVIEQKLAPELLIHDSRRQRTLEAFKFLLDHPFSSLVERLELHAAGSNLLHVTLRAQPLLYENWNRAEPCHRGRHLHLK